MKFVRTELSKLTRTEDTMACGCIGSGTVTPWQPADTASERPWLTLLAPAAIQRLNLDKASDSLKDLSMYACDLNRLRDCREQLQQLNPVMVVSKTIEKKTFCMARRVG